MYRSEDGKLYINKALPIYLFIGSKPDNPQEAIRLQSEISKSYTNPMYFDTEGINTIQSPSCVDTVTKQVVLPKRNIIFEVYADSKSPLTQISFGKTRIHKKKEKIYVSGQVEITLSAKDELSGVDKIMYSIDNKDYVEYTNPIILQEEKEYQLKYFSYDHVGNVEKIHHLVIVVDRSAPKISMEIKGDYYESVLAGNALLILQANDTLSETENIYYTLNEDKIQNYNKAITFNNLPQGEYTLSYWAVDNVGNETEKKSFSFYVDKTPPTIIPEIIGKTFLINGKEFSSGRSLLKISTIDNKAGTKEVFYSINNEPYQKYEKPVLLTNTGGKLFVRIFAFDHVMNKNEILEGAQTSSLPYIDLTGPTLSYSVIGPSILIGDTLFINKTSKIKIAAVDKEAGVSEILYSIDKIEYLKYITPFEVEKEGLHLLDISASDNVDNISSNSLLLYTDNTGPSISYLFSCPIYKNAQHNDTLIPVYPSYCKLFISATDRHTSVEKLTYSLNQSVEKPFTGFLSNFKGYNHLVIKAWDLLGNKSQIIIDFLVE